MVNTVFELKHGEKLDYTFDYTEDCNTLSATIEGTPVVTTLPASPALTVSAVTVDTTVKKATVIITAPTSGELEYTLSCKANLTGTPDRDFVQGIIIRVKPAVPQAAGGVTTVGRVISEFQITDAAKQALIPDYILEATEAIQTFLGFRLPQETVTEKVAGSSGHLLQLSRAPVSSITSITYDGTLLDADDYRLQNSLAGQIWLDNGVVDTSYPIGNLSGTSFAHQGKKLYEVIYVAGWIMPGVTGRTLPRDIERAGLDLVRSYINARSNPDIKSEEVPNVYNVTYFDRPTSGGSIPPAVADILNPYRMVVL